ncbi:DHA2 family efflux MFS transporter permease subunit [Streptomyces sp. SID8366]|uniref:MFS transporter n=1 Tax=unclassified Streptomyces TaxID=2593676 RepID=UPI000DB9C6E0|nr:MFS transporter [Streptomyces sp. PsTaAH-130]MYU07131.1 DHA2 family efflux MFS transporter permease subunit [Streptomyces sp. SID8366]MYU66356.1 DHA2 family efflux MFS transporter permease subunit [Streptomyces sp. SID69]RAJ61371.1 EmrB/QacA subfamily drug resistance transporter [Streptomyces sp. PsTaAH-130]
MTMSASPARGGTPAISEPPPPAGRLTHRQIMTILSGLMLGMFLAALDQTIVSTSIRTIADDLHGLSAQAWVTTAYLITSTISTPLYGKLSDLYGRKPFFLAAITIFIAGSAACSFATSMNELSAFRAFQGIGAGGLMSLALAIIGDIVPPRERARYQGYMLAMFGSSSVLGPLIGGFLAGRSSILAIAGWRWVFLVNVPVGIIALFVVAKVLNLPHTRREHRIDWWGALTIAVGVVPLLLVAEQGQTWGWTSTRSYVCYGIGVVGLVAWVLVERAMGDEALIPMRLFRSSVFSKMSLLSVLIGMGMFGGMMMVPLYLQIVKGVSPTKSGLLMLPLMVGMIAGTMVVGRIISKTGKYKIFPIIGTVLLIAAMLLFHYRVQWDSPLPETMAYMALFGLGLSGCMQILTLAVQNSVEPKDMGVATASATFFRQMGGTAGTAIFLSVLFSTVGDKIGSAFRSAAQTPAFQAALHDPAVRADPANAPVLDMIKHPATSGGGSGVLDDSSFIQQLDPRLAQPFKEGFTDAMHVVFLCAAAIMVLGFLVAVWTKEVPLRKVSGLEARAAEANGTQTEAADVKDAQVNAVAADSGQAPAVPLVEDAPVAVASVPAAGQTVRGRVLDGANAPVPQAAVTLIDVRGRQLDRAVSGVDGTYTASVPGAGTYVLIGAAGARQPQAVTVLVGDEPVICDLVLGGSGAALAGSVRDAAHGNPLPGALLVATDLRGEVVTSATSAADGGFSLADLVPGSYTLAVNAPGYRPAAVPVEVTPGAAEPCEIRLEAGAQLHGVISAATGGPLGDAKVTLLDAAGNVLGTATTGPDGAYGFTDLDLGEYTVIASGYAPVATSVRVDAGGTTDFDLELSHEDLAK